jgi:hypothetical protein
MIEQDRTLEWDYNLRSQMSKPYRYVRSGL